MYIHICTLYKASKSPVHCTVKTIRNIRNMFFFNNLIIIENFSYTEAFTFPMILRILENTLYIILYNV